MSGGSEELEGSNSGVVSDATIGSFTFCRRSRTDACAWSDGLLLLRGRPSVLSTKAIATMTEKKRAFLLLVVGMIGKWFVMQGILVSLIYILAYANSFPLYA